MREDSDERQNSGVRRQESGASRQEAEVRGQKSVARRHETGGGNPEGAWSGGSVGAYRAWEAPKDSGQAPESDSG